MYGEGLVRYEVVDRVAVLTLHRPDRLNTWVPELAHDYAAALDEAAADRTVRVVVVTGAGDAFCAGTDLARLAADLDHAAGRSSRRDANGRGRDGHRGDDARPAAIHPLTVPKPIVAAVNGACAGTGLSQALLCDVRFAAADARFAADHVRRGLVADDGLSWVLPRLVGPGRALELLLSGRVLTAMEAGELGLVHRVVPPDRLMPEVLAWAADVAAHCSPTALAAVKAQVWRHLDTDLATAVRESGELWDATVQAADFREALAALSERRQPRFPPFGG